ncbi:hypothetical protein HIM_07629 [Hirsutella minnesotensis 3608]|uniref:4-coumarate--CoA ligase-like 7 n=1 Tax=Hirsutella minnesotensis 3608 TaxID=1043627 RepID=A0A0F7ZYU0_9HYPO|nr:hypothetical protein HIM_07629 [Hirsutella minnesotensis 3608]
MCMEGPREYPDDHTLFVDCNDSRRAYTFAQVKELSVAFGRGLKHQLAWAKGDVLALYAPNDAGVPLDCVLLLGADRDETHRHWTDLSAAGAPVQPTKTPVDPKEDLAYLVYSSGTTGLPKGVQLTHYNVIANTAQTFKADIRSLCWDMDSQIGILPFFHIYGLSVVINSTLISGATCYVMPKFDIEATCRLVQERRVTYLYVPPPIVLLLSKHPVVERYDLSSLRFVNSGAAPLSRELVAAVWQRLSIGVKQGYGLSETSPVATVQLADEWWRIQGTVGRLVAGMTGKVVDEQGNEVPRGQTGELLLKGPNVFRGYWRRPELNKETFTDDGWYKTGDVVYADQKGYFYVTDRMKELIKYKGFQVPPAELEDKLLGHKDVADVGVIGVWDDERQTEIPRAYIVARPGVEPSDELARDIIAWLGERVSPPKRLRGGVRFIEAVPKSQAGKILRRILKETAKKDERPGKPQAKL